MIQKAAFFKQACYAAYGACGYSFATAQAIVRKIDGVVYIIFRATDTNADWKVHFTEFSLEDAEIFNRIDSRIRVRGGWIADYIGIRKYIINEIEYFIEKGDRRFCVVGHSYGGVLASYCALDLASFYCFADVSLVTFGAPKGGNRHFVNGLTAATTRGAEKTFVYGNDGVPCLPPMFCGYRKNNGTTYIGKRDWLVIFKNSVNIGFKWIQAMLKRQSFNYFQFVVAEDHLLEQIDNDMDIEF